MPHRILSEPPPEDRAAFVRENAVALLAERDVKIERLRKVVTRLEKTVRELRKRNRERGKT
ncbi:MAG: hypothetical protein IAF94_08615 [Pirellulaceae bacterium]|nr:hypothetical protein [Pirellulaceae bacterium]